MTFVANVNANNKVSVAMQINFILLLCDLMYLYVTKYTSLLNAKKTNVVIVYMYKKNSIIK